MSKQTVIAVANASGAITFGNPKTDNNNIAPRIGLAYDPKGNGKTTIRVGFGIAYDVKFQNFASITLPPQLQSELDPVSACTLLPPPSWCSTTNNTGFLAPSVLPSPYIPPANPGAPPHLHCAYYDASAI